ncbi:MAG: succinate dehydrogenase assembly factor 2 [Gammaproteobacteria bacterium]|nr:succinate dehydrogenase assembly factor 2 [Gammaproteobacteria bacterium]NND58638.1 succinate dehydrogenase assembly factor 2 [Gammaproteobacteria bacterium]
MADSAEIARLRWRCRRGMRELDLLMDGWLTRSYGSASAEQRQAFGELLECPDPQLLMWLTGREIPADPVTAELIDAIRERR